MKSAGQTKHNHKRLVRQTISTFRKRAATWEANEGELGKIVASELRCVLDVFEELISPDEIRVRQDD